MTYKEFLTKYDLTEEEAEVFLPLQERTPSLMPTKVKFGVLGQKGLDLWNLVDKKKMLSILNQQL